MLSTKAKENLFIFLIGTLIHVSVGLLTAFFHLKYDLSVFNLF